MKTFNPRNRALTVLVLAMQTLLLTHFLDLPAFAQAEGFQYPTVGGTVTIAGYTGPGGIVVIPDTIAGLTLSSIGDYAFISNTSLTSIVIPGSLTSTGEIGEYAFVGCTNVTSVTMGNGITGIGGSAFEGCTGLTSVTIGSSVTNIGEYAFVDCEGLRSLVIPDSVTSIGDWAFATCTSLTAVYFEGSVPGTDDLRLFQGSPVTIYFLPETSEWDAMYSARPTALWLPRLGPLAGQSGGDDNEFGMTAHWARGKTVRVESAIEPANPVWSPLATLHLADGSASFTDRDPPIQPMRFYRAVEFKPTL